jgi:hypothetical protein
MALKLRSNIAFSSPPHLSGIEADLAANDGLARTVRALPQADKRVYLFDYAVNPHNPRLRGYASADLCNNAAGPRKDISLSELPRYSDSDGEWRISTASIAAGQVGVSNIRPRCIPRHWRMSISSFCRRSCSPRNGATETSTCACNQCRFAFALEIHDDSPS